MPIKTTTRKYIRKWDFEFNLYQENLIFSAIERTLYECVAVNIKSVKSTFFLFKSNAMIRFFTDI